jgi:hypothetical protein
MTDAEAICEAVTRANMWFVPIFIFGSGHLLAGLTVMLSDYLVSVLLVGPLVKFVKPKLLTLSWFVVIWKQFVETRRKSVPLAKV